MLIVTIATRRTRAVYILIFCVGGRAMKFLLDAGLWGLFVSNLILSLEKEFVALKAELRQIQNLRQMLLHYTCCMYIHIKR